MKSTELNSLLTNMLNYSEFLKKEEALMKSLAEQYSDKQAALDHAVYGLFQALENRIVNDIDKLSKTASNVVPTAWDEIHKEEKATEGWLNIKAAIQQYNVEANKTQEPVLAYAGPTNGAIAFILTHLMMSRNPDLISNTVYLMFPWMGTHIQMCSILSSSLTKIEAALEQSK